MPAFQQNMVLLQDETRWLLYQNPETIITARSLEDVLPALILIEKHVETDHAFAAGFLSYEAGPAFDKALKTHPQTDFPLLWFGLYKQPEILEILPEIRTSYHLDRWQPDTDISVYMQTVNRIRDYLAGGDTYQVNYTIRMRTRFSGDPYGLFRRITDSQKAAYGAFLDIGKFTICSASPELFFSLDKHDLTSRPMKGTAPRGKFLTEDRRMAENLKTSEKNRAENVMIVDMMRNDMGRVAVPGSVQVTKCFDVEKYPTVWQMTSTVKSQTAAPITDILRALYPCASITGAPKPRTMEIIRDLETSPRNIYTGAIGMIGPSRQARFSVAIRTVLVNRKSGQAEYGVGGGIVWDSTAEEEYHECRIKARVLTESRPLFKLLESLLWTPEKGYYLQDYHIKRLMASARYFEFPVSVQDIKRKLESAVPEFPDTPVKVRLLVSREGSLGLNWEKPRSSESLTVSLARTPVNRDDIFLYHKTTHRQTYEKALSEKGQTDDVLLWNDQDELTEASSSNIVLQFGNAFYTPPVTSGLLPGTRRAELLDQGKIQEKVLKKSQLAETDGIFLINSVRPWREAVYRPSRKI